MPQARKQSGTDDVLVAGGGPAGLALALALARRGNTVVVADAAAPVSARSPAQTATRRETGTSEAGAASGRFFFIAHGCWRIFEALDVADALLPLAEPVREVRAEGGGGGISFLAGEAGEDGALGYMLAAADLSAVLLKAVKETDGVRLIAPARITGASFGDPRAVAQTDAGEIAARLIVGCDGARSGVRQAAGVRFEGRDYKEKALSAVLKLDASHQGAARQVFLRHGPLALLPLRDNRVNLVWTERGAVADALAAMSDADFSAELAKQAGDFVGGFVVEGARAAFPLGLYIAERFHGPRMALAGDAAHVVHPLAGQGLNLGLKDIAALVDVIADAARVGLDIGSEAALAPYTRWRRADVVATAAAMEGFAQAFAAPAPVRMVAGLAMRAAGAVAPVRKMFAREAGGVLGELPTLMRG